MTGSRPPGRGIAALWHSLLRLGTVIGVKGVNIGISMVMTLVLARLGGPAVLGEYALAFQTAQLLSILAVMGRDQIVLREVAGHLRLSLPARARADLQAGAAFVAPWALLLAGAFALLGLGGRWSGLWAPGDALLLAALVLPANAAYLLGLGALRGSGNPVMAQLFDGLFTLPMLILLLAMWAAGIAITAERAVLASAISLGGVMLLLWLLLARQMRSWGAEGPAGDEAKPAGGWRDGLPLMSISFLIYLAQWVPLALAGALGDAAQAGAFRAAWQLTSPLMIIYTTVAATVLGPVAGDLKQGDHLKAGRRLARTRQAMLATALPLALPLLIWPHELVGLLFGPAFAGTEDLLRALVLANLVPILVGPIGAAVTMARRNAELVPAMLAGTLLMLMLSLWLVPVIGMVGLAVGYGAALATRFGAAWWLGRRILAGRA